ncbi:MAG: class I SAM-dependent methyltransferase [Thermaerobacter sp.]|nr:class I SAM-dependent methyltransferase [Thermaerobacter sp.]
MDETEERAHFHHHVRDRIWTREHLANLEHPDRETYMPKAPVLAALKAGRGQRVADIGAGLGYFTLPLAGSVGREGAAIAVDPSPDACAELVKRAEQAGLSQLAVIQAGAEKTPILSGSLDGVLWHTMYHDVPDLAAAFLEMRRILRRGGRWVIVDWLKEETGLGPPLSVRVHRDEAEAAGVAAGFSVLERFVPGPVTWGLVLGKP